MIRIGVTLALAAGIGLAACSGGNGGDGDMTEGAAGSEGDGEATYAYAEWDVNGDRALSRDEFGTWAAEVGWPTMDEATFARAAYDLWNVDGDTVVSAQEWEQATRRWYGEAIPFGPWSAWDADGDASLDPEEVASAFARHRLHEPVDRNDDGRLDDVELADWWFSVWDFDDDQAVDSSEWDWGTTYGYDRIPGSTTEGRTGARGRVSPGVG